MNDQAQDLRDILKAQEEKEAERLNGLFDEIVEAVQQTTGIEDIELLTIEFDPRVKFAGDKVHISISGVDCDEGVEADYSSDAATFFDGLNGLV